MSKLTRTFNDLSRLRAMLGRARQKASQKPITLASSAAGIGTRIAGDSRRRKPPITLARSARSEDAT